MILRNLQGEELRQGLLRVYRDPTLRLALDPDSQGAYLAGLALHEAEQELRGDPAKTETQLRAEWGRELPEPQPLPLRLVTRRALDLIAAKIRTGSTDLRYREALRVALRRLEEVLG